MLGETIKKYIVKMKGSAKSHPVAVIGSTKIHTLGYLYAIIPVGAGAIIMLAVALLVNNIPKNRQYPEYWY